MRPAALAFGALLLLGCPKPVEDEGPFVPKPVLFQGKIDERFFGNWESADGRAGLSLAKDGAAKIVLVRATPSGDERANLEGRWLAAGEDLLLRYEDKSHQETILKYSATFSKGSLTLQQPGGRLKTIYRRK